MTEELNREDIITKAARHLLKESYIIQKTVAEGNKFCGVIYVPKKYKKHKAIVIILEDENT